jgi:hypothetical protein
MDQGYLVGSQSNCYPSQKLFISSFPISVNLSFVPFSSWSRANTHLHDDIVYIVPNLYPQLVRRRNKIIRLFLKSRQILILGLTFFGWCKRLTVWVRNVVCFGHAIPSRWSSPSLTHKLVFCDCVENRTDYLWQFLRVLFRRVRKIAKID